MSNPKQIVFKEMELFKEGRTAAGKPWTKYQYYGDDGEHYILFDKLELDKPYTLVEEEKQGKDGKVYKNWKVVNKEKSAGNGAGKAILDQLELVKAEIADLKRMVTELLGRTPLPVLDESQLPF